MYQAKLGGPAIGAAPAVPSRGPSIGAAPAIPAAQPHIEPAPYDAAMDPSWKGVLDPSDHELRNFLNGLSPEERQMLLVRLGKAAPVAPAPVAPQGA